MFGDLIRKIKANEREALFFMEFDNLVDAEKVLLENIRVQTDSILTYDLLIRIYHQRNDQLSLLRLLNCGIQNTNKKSFYRKLKKQVILYRLVVDLDHIDA